MVLQMAGRSQLGTHYQATQDTRNEATQVSEVINVRIQHSQSNLVGCPDTNDEAHAMVTYLDP